MIKGLIDKNSLRKVAQAAASIYLRSEYLLQFSPTVTADGIEISIIFLRHKF